MSFSLLAYIIHIVGLWVPYGSLLIAYNLSGIVLCIFIICMFVRMYAIAQQSIRVVTCFS